MKIIDFSGPTKRPTRKEIFYAPERAAPWLGRMIADGGHTVCVMPNDAVATLQRIEDLLKREREARS